MKSPEPLGSPSILKSPVKPTMGLPDQTGLIVGVNTINYDVSFRNKSKTREEKKMEMIMKAIEAMERAEARKRTEGCDSSSEKPEKKRRRSNSTKTSKQDHHNSVDSNLDASSADESSAGGSKVRAGKGRGKRSLGLAARRRSRAKSGDSSALSDADGCTDIAGVEEGGVTSPSSRPQPPRRQQSRPEKSWLAMQWAGIDTKLFKPLLTHAHPTLMETTHNRCLPLARLFTSKQQWEKHPLLQPKGEEEGSSPDLESGAFSTGQEEGQANGQGHY